MNIIDMAASVGIDPKTIRAMVYKDECNDLFFLTKNAEIFPLNDHEIRLYLWPKKSDRIKATLASTEPDLEIDDEYCVRRANVAKLPEILRNLALPKQRFQRGSKWIRNLEKVLGHQIVQWTPGITKA